MPSSMDHDSKDEKDHANVVVNELDSHAPPPGRMPRGQNLSPELKAALEASNINKWSKESWTLYAGVFCATLGSYSNGFDYAMLSALLAMPYFQIQFNHLGYSGPFVGIVTAMLSFGSMVGGPAGAHLMDRFGRLRGMMMGAVTNLVGIVLCSAATHIAMFMVGRFFIGAGISMMAGGASVYAMEIAFPQWRGRSTGIVNCGWFFGSIPAAAALFGCSYIKGHLSWRIPLILQAISAVALLVIAPFLPESPRFLLARGRRDEAVAFLVKYHGQGDPNSPIVELEIKEMDQSIALDALEKDPYNYGVVFNTHARRWRMAQVLMMGVFGQFSGYGLGYFVIAIYKIIGITGATTQLGYNLLIACLSMFFGIGGAIASDFVPRRVVLPYGNLVLATLLAIFGALNWTMEHQGAKLQSFAAAGKGALAMYILFKCAFSFVYVPYWGIVPVEACSMDMRAKAGGLYWSTMMVMNVVSIFSLAVGMEQIGYHVVWIFVAADVIYAICWYLFGVEAQGKTLEELDWIYEQPNPVKASKQRRPRPHTV